MSSSSPVSSRPFSVSDTPPEPPAAPTEVLSFPTAPAGSWPGPLEAARLRALLMQAPVGIALTRGPDFVFELANPLYEKLMGRRVALGQPLARVLPEVVSQSPVMEALQQVMRTGEPFVGKAFPVSLDRSGDGRLEEALFDIVYHPMRDARDQVDGLLTLAVEVTEQVNARQRAESMAEHLARQAHALEGWERLFAHGGLGIATMDPSSGGLRAVNAAFARMHGYALPSELEGVAVASLVAPAFQASYAAQLVITREKGHHTYEQVHLRKDGTSFPVQVDGVVLCDAGGQVVYRGVVVQDLTARKAAEERFTFLARAGEVLSSSLDWRTVLRQLAELAVPRLSDGCAVDMLTEDGRVERLVAAHRDPQKVPLVFELARRWPIDLSARGGVGEVLRTGRALLIPPLSDASASAYTRAPEHLEQLRRMSFQGAMAVPLRARGRVLGCAVFTAEESGRRFTEDDLALALELARRASLSVDHALLYAEAREAQARTERLQSVTAALSRAATADAVAEVLMREGLQASGAVRGAVLLCEASGFVRPVRAQGYAPATLAQIERTRVGALPLLARALERREAQWFSSEDVLRAAYPEPVAPLEFTGEGARAVLPLMTGARVVGFLMLGWSLPRTFSAEERTFLEAVAHQCAQALGRAELYEALHEAHAQAQAAVRMRDEFLSVASHELKTPLTSLILQHGLIVRALGPDASERVGPRLTTAMRQVQRLTALVENLLDVSRLALGKLALEPAEVDLAQAVHDAVERLEEVFAQARCAVTVEAAGPLTGQWDALRLDQVLVNLLSNAAKYGAGRPVRVRAGIDAQGQAWVEVRDEGIGIAPEALPRLFGRFERAVSDKHYGGLGLGLYISRQIVEALGGRIEVESRPAQGSTFTVRLPLAPPEVPAPSGSGTG